MNLINLIKLYSYSIFDDITLPNGLSHEILVNTIMDKCAVFTPLYSDVDILVPKIQMFFKKNLSVFQKLYNTSLINYDPIENYDRKEHYDDSYTRSNNNNTQNNDNSNSLTTNLVSPYDMNAFVNDSQSNGSASLSNYGSHLQYIKDSTTHDYRAHGNIGVTTSQQMIESELTLIPKLNVYEIISSFFFNEFMLFDY